MSVIIVLLIASLSVSLIFLGAFIWSVRHKQFEDPFSPPRRILFDDRSEIPDDQVEKTATWKMSGFTKKINTPNNLN